MYGSHRPERESAVRIYPPGACFSGGELSRAFPLRTMWSAKLSLAVRGKHVVVMRKVRPSGAARMDIASHGVLAHPGVGIGNSRSYATGVTVSAIDVELGC